MANKQKSNVLAIIGMISFVTNLASPMGDVLKNQFGVANWMGTLGVFANFIAYAIMGIPAGNMLQKYGYKKTALVAVTVGGSVAGIMGMVMSVPLCSVIYTLLSEKVEQSLSEKNMSDLD